MTARSGRIGTPDRITGPQLIDRLRRAARLKGQTLNVFALPLASSTVTNFIQQLGRSEFPKALTIERVEACIAGRPVPSAQAGRCKGPTRKRVHTAEASVRMPAEVIEQRRRLAELAHAERRAGETLHQALQRLQPEGDDHHA